MADLTAMLQAAAGYAASAGYQISRSLRFNSADTAELSRTPASAGNRKTWTWSGWVKISAFNTTRTLFSAGTDGDNRLIVTFRAANNELQFFSSSGGSTVINRYGAAVQRDPLSWYHIVAVFDTTEASATDRCRAYINGEQINLTASTTSPSLNSDSFINSTNTHYLGYNSAGIWADFLLTEVHFVDGQALTANDFGEVDETTGVWKPKAYQGTYGSNGFYVNFSDNSAATSSALGKDYSGNNNDWTPTNFSVSSGVGNDSFVDTPTRYGNDTGLGGQVRGNYFTLNQIQPKGASTTFSNGNLTYVNTAASSDQTVIFVGDQVTQHYFEATATTISASSSFNLVGNVRAFYRSNGEIWVDGSLATTVATYTSGDVLGFAVIVGGAVQFYKNGSLVYTSSGSAGVAIIVNGFSSTQWDLNFGQHPFTHAAPTGYKCLCTTNFSEPTIVEGRQHFDISLYTGTGSSLAVTGLEFRPDLLWIKRRSGTTDHGVYDAVRGNTSQLETNNADAETVFGSAQVLFQPAGFTVGVLAQLNASGATYVGWTWNAGGSNATNTDGTITSTVRANPTAGFSIVSYTGTGSAATIGHGLGAAPAMIIVKNRDAADAWQVYHQANTAAPETDYLVLNTTAATADNANRWNDTAPTSSVFSIGNGVEVNTNTEDYIAYVFATVSNYSRISVYTGNGSANGTFVFTGFRPAFIMIKRTNSTSNWTIIDTKREGYNVDNDPLYPNLNNAEGTTDLADILCNGFKLRSTDASVNASGGTYIFISFAENPFKYSLAR